MTKPHPTAQAPGNRPAAQACRTELQLNYGNHFRLHAAQDMRVRALRGIAWITLESEAGETMVRAGNDFVISSGKTALVGPLHQSVTLELGIAPAAPTCLASRPMLAKLRRLAQGLGFGMAQ